MSYIQNAANGIGGCPRDFVRKHAKIETKGLPTYVRELAITRFKEIIRRTHGVLHDINDDPVKIDPSVFNVFEVLMKHFHNKDTGQCNPSARKIAEELGCSTKTVVRANKVFVRIGLFKVLKTTYTPSEKQKKKLPPKTRKYKKIRGSNRYHLVKGVLNAMFAVIKRLDAGGKILSLVKVLGLKEIAKKKKYNKFSKTLDQKKHDAQQELFRLQDSPISPRDGCDDYDDHIDSLPMAPVRVKSDPAQELLARRYQGAL